MDDLPHPMTEILTKIDFNAGTRNLFLRIAEASPTEKRVREWLLVASGGKLGSGGWAGGEVAHLDPEFDRFLHQVYAVQKLSWLWLAVIDRRCKWYDACISWERDADDRPAVFFTFNPCLLAHDWFAASKTPERELIASSGFRADWLKEFETDESTGPAMLYIASKVDEQLALIKGWRVRLQFEYGEKYPMFAIEAPDIFGAAWMDFAQAVADNRKFRSCDLCDKWFEVAPDAARTHRRYCSEACRGKAFRDRQDRARQLYAQKKSVEEIAKQLNLDVESVRKWVSETKGS